MIFLMHYSSQFHFHYNNKMAVQILIIGVVVGLIFITGKWLIKEKENEISPR